MTQSFSALGVSAPVLGALDRLGITSPFAIQNLVLPDALAGIDIMAAAPTGSGKTLAFGIPMVERIVGADGRPSALVLVPTRELASQIVADLQPLAAARNLRIAAVYGGTSVGGQAQKARGAQILVATPGRLHDLLERRLVSLAGGARARARRSRSHARHGLPPAGRPHRRADSAEPPDDALLGDARRPRG